MRERRKAFGMQINAVLTAAEEGGFIAHDPATGTVGQGETIEQAIANLHEAVALYLDEFPGAAP